MFGDADAESETAAAFAAQPRAGSLLRPGAEPESPAGESVVIGGAYKVRTPYGHAPYHYTVL